MKKRLSRLWLYLTVILTLGLLLFPIYWMFNTSITPPAKLNEFPPQFIQPDPQIGAYIKILFERPMLTWIGNSAFVAIVSTAISMAVSVLAAYSLSRFRVRGGNAMGIFILSSRMLPSTMLIIPLFIFFRQLGFIGDFRSVIISHATFIIPFATWMLKGYFDSIPKELEEAAMIDGCNPLSALFRVIMPLSLPGVAATTLYGFILSWNDFLFAKTFLATSQSSWTVMLGMSTLKGEYTTPWNEVMAAALITVLPIVIAYFFLEKYLVGGMTAGAIK